MKEKANDSKSDDDLKLSCWLSVAEGAPSYHYIAVPVKAPLRPRLA